MRFNQLAQWLSWLESLHPNEIDLGLERIARVASNLDVLKPNAKVITFAGTNGKGSTLTYCASILQQAGHKVGAFVSPHFERYNERIAINGTPVDDQSLCESFARIDAARGDISLTYFEFGTLAALDLFKLNDVDVYLLEVGLGGRLDAVNCIDADVAVVSSIGLDHQDWLGSDLGVIALEKAGISRPGKPLVCGEEHPPECLIEKMQQQGTPVFLRGRDFGAVARQNDAEWVFNWSDELLFDQLPFPKLPFQNAQTALAAIKLLNLPVKLESIRSGLESAWISGRFEVISEKPLVVVDVAHNPQAAGYLSEQLKVRAPKWRALAALLSDKDARDVVSNLTSSVGEWHFAGLDVPRGRSGEVLAAEVSGLLTRTSAHKTVDDALDVLLDESELPLVIFGSFYTVAQAIRYFQLRNANG